MSTFPIKEDDDESKLSHEKEIKSVFEEAMQDEDLEQVTLSFSYSFIYNSLIIIIK